MNLPLLEICCYSLESAIIAEKQGANRIELCAGIHEGGTTPSYSTIKLAVKKLKIPVHVIIRPRGGDFLYSNQEFELIKEDIEICKSLGVKGIVCGILNSNGTIDIKRNKEIINLTKPMSFTFHRAIDMVQDFEKSIEDLIQLGANRVLTSGGMKNVEAGINNLCKWNKKYGKEIIIMPGCGINEHNLKKLHTQIQAKEYHGSFKTTLQSPMNYINKNISMSGTNDSEYVKYITDGNALKKALNSLKK